MANIPQNTATKSNFSQYVQRSNVGFLQLAIGLHDRQCHFQSTGLRRLKAESVSIVFAGHVPGKRVETVRPPEAGSVVLIEGENLLRQFLGGARFDGEVAVEDVVDLGSVLHEVAVSEAAIADAVAHDEMVRAVNRQPAVVAVPD